jgi:hypothetical protein
MFELVLIVFFTAIALAFAQWWRGPDVPMS